jgi:hypothetical protein
MMRSFLLLPGGLYLYLTFFVCNSCCFLGGMECGGVGAGLYNGFAFR